MACAHRPSVTPGRTLQADVFRLPRAGEGGRATAHMRELSRHAPRWAERLRPVPRPGERLDAGRLRPQRLLPDHRSPHEVAVRAVSPGGPIRRHIARLRVVPRHAPRWADRLLRVPHDREVQAVDVPPFQRIQPRGRTARETGLLALSPGQPVRAYL